MNKKTDLSAQLLRDENAALKEEMEALKLVLAKPDSKLSLVESAEDIVQKLSNARRSYRLLNLNFDSLEERLQSRFSHQIQALETSEAKQRLSAKNMQKKTTAQEDTVKKLTAEASNFKEKATSLQQKVKHLENQISSLEKSTSWRLTSPLRKFRKLVS